MIYFYEMCRLASILLYNIPFSIKTSVSPTPHPLQVQVLPQEQLWAPPEQLQLDPQSQAMVDNLDIFKVGVQIDCIWEDEEKGLLWQKDSFYRGLTCSVIMASVKKHMICLHVPYFFVNLGDLKYTTYTVKDY
jgi:hypothetical protein